MNKKIALLTGGTGQDGSYLIEFLLSKNYEVHNIIRRSSTFTTSRIDKIINDKKHDYYGHYGDLFDSSSLNRLIRTIKPTEIYNLGAQSHVAVSFKIPEYTSEVNAIGTLRILDALIETNSQCKFYQASTSELFAGFKSTIPQNEKTAMEPRSPYAISKLFSYWITKNYREAYGVFASNGILFNHESPRRGGTFVTKKIVREVSNIVNGKKSILKLGNLNSIRDWGYAKEYVEAMWLILQQQNPDDFVVATGKGTTVREFVEYAFGYTGISLYWKGSGLKEKGYDKKTGTLLVAVDKKYFRPTEVECLIGDYKKIHKKTGWKPKTNIKKLVKIMMEHELKSFKQL
tara:strand:- start:378 stop:1412 length:1035 start_codon:yes stop_codon:yes gene_type:complete